MTQYEYCRDGRSEEQFKKDLGGQTETIIFKQILDLFKICDCNFSYDDFGIDNTGKLIKKRGERGKPDFKLTLRCKDFNETILVDIKKNNKGYQGSLKLEEVSALLKYEAIAFLIIDYEDKGMNDNSHIYLIGKHTLNNIKELVPVTRLFANSKKMGYRLKKKELDGLSMVKFEYGSSNNFLEWFIFQYKEQHAKKN